VGSHYLWKNCASWHKFKQKGLLKTTSCGKIFKLGIEP